MEEVLLHVEMLPNEQMNFKLKGDPVLVAKMISTAMHYKQEVAAAMIACVVEYAESEGFDCGDLSKMVQFKR